MSKILAKSKNNISLSEHTAELLRQFEVLYPYFNNKFQQNCYQLITRAIAVHDIGKVSPCFQVNSLSNWNYTPKVTFPNVAHSMFSLFWISDMIFENLEKDERQILCSAVAFHHWRNNFEFILVGDDTDFIDAAKRLLNNKKLREKLENNLHEEFKKNGMEKLAGYIKFNEEFAETVADGVAIFDYLTPPYLDYFLPQRISIEEESKLKSVIVSGVLMRLDHFASYKQENFADENVEKNYPAYEIIKQNITKFISSKIGDQSFDFWQHDELKNKKNENVILIAPTGTGKTEFAALWGAGNKLFVTLPLRSAVNAAFDRFGSYFDEGNTGILHSDADVYLYEKEIQSETDCMRVLDMARQLSLPVCVSTGDQMFPAALKYPGYEKIYATLGYSRLVIDEVQAYDPKSIAIIVKLIEDIVKLGGKFLLMTATLPLFVKDEINKRTNFKEELTNKYIGLERIKKHRIELIYQRIDDSKTIEEIVETAKKGNRVLVIVNTVPQAQKLYESIEDRIEKDEVFIDLLHSKYTLYDRKQKEEKIIGKKDSDQENGLFANPKPEDENIAKILIATQVIEASVDIDADILFTEIAPIDSLVQRMGRVLRRIKCKADEEYTYEGEPNIKIYFHDEGKNKRFLLESGNGYVYQNDLLSFSLFLLIERVTGKNLIKDLLEKFKKEQNKTKKDRNDKMELIKNSVQKNMKKKKDFCEKEFLISETEKKELVERLYEKLFEDSPYKEKFYEMLTVLDSGYMSDRKSDALKIFREIYSSQVIHSKMEHEFRQEIKKYCKKHKDQLTWPAFKSEVLSKFVFSLNNWSFERTSCGRADNYLDNLEIGKQELSIISRWVKDFLVIRQGSYDESLGYVNPNKSENIPIGMIL